MTTASQPNLLDFFHAMLRIRRAEEALADRYAEQQMRCPMHLCIGQEAVAVGVGAALRRDDVVFSNHRAHGHYLAKGGDLSRMLSEIYGRATGCCGGRGGSMHLIDTDVNFLGSTPIVGGTVPLAVGAAWSASLRNTDTVAVAYFGDGCFEEGVIHESFNFAALHRLPILFVCENNDFSVYTPLRERQPVRPIHAIASAHGWNTSVCDGNDVAMVHHLASEAVARARHGDGPQFLEFSVFRWREHCGPSFDDELNYRSREEVERGRSACPIVRLQRQLVASGALDASVERRIEQGIAEEIQAAFYFAFASPSPTPQDSTTKVYAS